MTSDHHNHGHRVDIIDIPSPRTSDSDNIDFSSSSSDKNHSWDNATDLLLTSWREEAKKAANVQLKSYYLYQRLNNWITYPSILLSAFASIGTFANEHEIPSLKFCLAAAAFVSGTLVAVNKNLRAAEKSQEHLLKAREFENLIRDMDYIQSQRASESMAQLKSDFERITANQPQPPRRFKSFRDLISR